MIIRMPPELTKEIADALHAKNGDLRVIDPTTQRVYVLVDDETHERAMQALRQQDDWESIQRGAAQADAGEGMDLEEADQKLRSQLGFPRRS
jgi:predicted transcriptional regulator